VTTRDGDDGDPAGSPSPGTAWAEARQGSPGRATFQAARVRLAVDAAGASADRPVHLLPLRPRRGDQPPAEHRHPPGREPLRRTAQLPAGRRRADVLVVGHDHPDVHRRRRAPGRVRGARRGAPAQPELPRGPGSSGPRHPALGHPAGGGGHHVAAAATRELRRAQRPAAAVRHHRRLPVVADRPGVGPRRGRAPGQGAAGCYTRH
jgi:hypothetical protein